MATEAKTALALEMNRKQLIADADNKEKTGVGTRTRVGATRGRNPVVITWDAFDETQPETLPTSIEQFLSVTGLNPAKDEAAITSLLIGGFNDSAYTAASDPLAEYVDDSWPADTRTQFRLVVRNYSRGAQVSLEDAVDLLKPGFVAQFSKK